MRILGAHNADISVIDNALLGEKHDETLARARPDRVGKPEREARRMPIFAVLITIFCQPT